MKRVILVRHGRTAWNDPDLQTQRFRGTTDVPLTGQGLEQAQITARRLAHGPVTAFYSSPLQRAARTAEILAQPHGLTPQLVPGLSSMSYGQWAGLTHREVARRWPDLYDRWNQNPFDVAVPDGENLRDLVQRAFAALKDILDRHAQGESVVIVSHQVVTRALICAMAGLPDSSWWSFAQDLCNLSCFDYDPASDTFILERLNDTCHIHPVLPPSGRRGTRLILVRHGQTAWNLGAGEERFRGRTDLPLDAVGFAQADAVAQRLQSETIDAIYASPLLRTRQTIAPLAQAQGQTVQPHEGLLDIDYGAFQGLTHSQAAALYPDLHRAWRHAPGAVRFPQGEGLVDVQRRLLDLLQELAARHPDQTVVLVGHQIVNKVLACTLLGLDLDQIWRVGQEPAALNLFQQRDGLWRTLCLNDTCHLLAEGSAIPHQNGA